MKSIFNALCSKGLPARDLKNANRVNLLAVLWALSLLVGSLLSQYYSLSVLVISLAFITHTVIGIAMVFAYKRYLTELDEMERKIQLDALALSVGVTIIGFSSYSILAKNGILPELNSAYLIALMALTYIAGIISGRLRYS
ncbi:conserved hypothetical protein [Shewanella sediminis HAW-EB3]|uniref:Uncharacterized protein n=1 Tax=Shewanella sediminis (strain HAW-EB3) TaxID=425104 RepID=A8G1J2_SHESH|nr:hypothetical protein [Shewanella sediminis]ABV38965.1 conserved hypothetical protein [Shewanella sediminis HAW-EB3]